MQTPTKPTDGATLAYLRAALASHGIHGDPLSVKNRQAGIAALLQAWLDMTPATASEQADDKKAA